ncbi:mannose-P-dolichol utilization defect 1 protein-like [Saccostrea echinata]|uniref:mannose-P-dolichol utilization defect 1 protein-like n=1 Tax=Saccostrea echinata TaxID=191078 RepID=UPI002A819471|nr:mannose-P-dolichol utilization defect 1 protein-like [Saccostrea echinata]XP_061189499.1 mannose-P-dolichol utilization defect 1 protein-like [Saccostrea echinata]
MAGDNTTTGLENYLHIIFPQPCYDEYFVKFNFFHAQCFNIVLSKALGYSIILGAVMVKLPQIVKILKAGSGEGISLAAVLCELFAISATTTYAFAMSFPFSAYGEGLFLTIQTSTIAFLILFLGSNAAGAFLFGASYIGIMAYLLSGLCPLPILGALQSINIPIVILSKMLQAVTNFRNGGTGQLSVVTVFLLFAGSLARVFTSIQETGDTLIIVTFIVSTVFNGLIFAQILYYWNAKPKKD